MGKYPGVFDEKRFIFVHIPKTAGKSIGALIGLKGACHLTMAEYENVIGRESLNEYFVFSVLRDPADRAVSAWNYIMGGGNQSKEDRALRKKLLSQSCSLNNFIIHHLGSQEYLSLKIFKPQRDYLSLLNGDIPDNIVLMRVESLSKDIRLLPERVLIGGRDLPHENKSQPSGIELSQSAIEKLREIYRSDYELLKNLECSCGS